MIAVIKTGGKQYLVAPQDVLKIEKIGGNAGETVRFDQVLFVYDKDANQIEVGKPMLSGKNVEAKILEQGRGRKVRVVKYKAKTRYKKVIGHRQEYTKVEIIK